MTDHARGLLLTAIGVLFLTPDTLLIRLIDIDQWTMVFWRGALMAAGLMIVTLVVEGRATIQAFRRIGRAGLGIALGFGGSSACFVAAVEHTTVANTLVIIASAPMFAALFSRIFLDERVRPRTLVAIGGTFCGILLVMGDGLARGDVLGNLAALATAIFMAGAFVVMRLKRDVNMIPAVALGSALPALGTLAAGLAAPLSVPLENVWLLILMGFVLLPISFGLISIGPRYIPAPEVSLLLLLETVLGPLWVWLVIGENVGTMTLIGGAVVISTLAFNSALSLREIPALKSA